jgi:hypothetical protein
VDCTAIVPHCDCGFQRRPAVAPEMRYIVCNSAHFAVASFAALGSQHHIMQCPHSCSTEAAHHAELSRCSVTQEYLQQHVWSLQTSCFVKSLPYMPSGGYVRSAIHLVCFLEIRQRKCIMHQEDRAIENAEHRKGPSRNHKR